VSAGALNGRPQVALRVALLTPCFWPEVRRGSERFARELADGLLARGQRPRLITSHPGRPSRTVEDGLPITRHWRPPDGRLVRRHYEHYLTHVPFSYLSLRGEDDDVAHALFAADAQAAARWTRRTGRPSVYSHMGIPDHRDLMDRRLRLDLVVRAVRECSAVTALSRTAAEAFWRWLGVEARVIHPGVNTSAFRPVSRRAERPTIFCAADPAEPRKRVALLVDAYRLVRRERPDTRLVLSRPRDGEVAARFETELPDVELAAVDDREALARAYSEAWVSALPSFGEAFGLVLAEAMACGTPVVASKVGGMREVVDRDTVGRLFDGDRPEDLARALIEALELAEDPATGEACRSRADDFSVDRCVERYLDLYRELVGEPLQGRPSAPAMAR
jgi:glycosyltransferase involved in cell wall biosynthesis